MNNKVSRRSVKRGKQNKIYSHQQLYTPQSAKKNNTSPVHIGTIHNCARIRSISWLGADLQAAGEPATSLNDDLNGVQVQVVQVFISASFCSFAFILRLTHFTWILGWSKTAACSPGSYPTTTLSTGKAASRPSPSVGY